MKLDALTTLIDRLRQCRALAEREGLHFIKHLLDAAVIEAVHEMDRQLGHRSNGDGEPPGK